MVNVYSSRKGQGAGFLMRARGGKLPKGPSRIPCPSIYCGSAKCWGRANQFTPLILLTLIHLISCY